MKNCALVNPAHSSTSTAKSHGIGEPIEVSQGSERGDAPCPHENYRIKEEDIGLFDETCVVRILELSICGEGPRVRHVW